MLPTRRRRHHLEYCTISRSVRVAAKKPRQKTPQELKMNTSLPYHPRKHSPERQAGPALLTLCPSQYMFCVHLVDLGSIYHGTCICAAFRFLSFFFPLVHVIPPSQVPQDVIGKRKKVTKRKKKIEITFNRRILWLIQCRLGGLCTNGKRE